jgi:cyclopropane-fatty-acyl-phospholipid synthase
MAFADSLQRSFTMRLEAAGIKIGEDVIVHDDSVFEQITFYGTLGMGESYVQGKWDSPNLRDVLSRGLNAGIPAGTLNIPYYLLKLHHMLTNPERRDKAQKIAEHYNIGNALYEKMLGKEMVYTCAYFGRGAKTLEQAQRDKLRLVCEKIDLKPGEHVLDIGCGFGFFARFAAREFGARVTGITISPEQLQYGQEFCEGLDVDLQLMNYLDLLDSFPPHSFDHVVSLGMFEHVGPKNYARFMEILRRLIKPGKYSLLHSIIGSGQDPWINKYIFPGGVLPREDQVTKAARDQGLVVENVQNFGPDYATTLAMWRKNFKAGWPELQLSGEFGTTPEERERFYRMWIFYLTVSEVEFLNRLTQLDQFVLSFGVRERYNPVY